MNRGLILLFRGNGQAGGRGKGRSFVSSRGLLLAVAAGGHHWHCGSQSQCVAWWISAVAREVRCCAFPLAAPPLRCVRCLLVSCENTRPPPRRSKREEQCGVGVASAERFAVAAGGGSGPLACNCRSRTATHGLAASCSGQASSDQRGRPPDCCLFVFDSLSLLRFSPLSLCLSLSKRPAGILLACS